MCPTKIAAILLVLVLTLGPVSLRNALAAGDLHEVAPRTFTTAAADTGAEDAAQPECPSQRGTGATHGFWREVPDASHDGGVAVDRCRGSDSGGAWSRSDPSPGATPSPRPAVT